MLMPSLFHSIWDRRNRCKSPHLAPVHSSIPIETRFVGGTCLQMNLTPSAMPSRLVQFVSEAFSYTSR